MCVKDTHALDAQEYLYYLELAYNSAYNKYDPYDIIKQSRFLND